MKKAAKIKHTNLKDCNDKLLGAFNVFKVYARLIQDVTEKIADFPECREWLKDYDYGVVLLLNADVSPTMELGLYRILGTCHKCESIIPYSFSPRIRLLHITLAYLIENGNFDGRSVRMPGEDDVIEALKRHEIYMEFFAVCDQCGNNNYSCLDEDGVHLDNKMKPKLTV